MLGAKIILCIVALILLYGFHKSGRHSVFTWIIVLLLMSAYVVFGFYHFDRLKLRDDNDIKHETFMPKASIEDEYHFDPS
jgi:Ca2+/Na+ antiporter